MTHSTKLARWYVLCSIRENDYDVRHFEFVYLFVSCNLEDLFKHCVIGFNIYFFPFILFIIMD